MIIGIDIGGTNFRIGAIDQDNKIYNFKKIYIDDVLKTGDVLKDIENIIKDNFKDINIDAIAIGIPGTLDVERKVIVQVPNVKGMNNLNAVEYLNNVFNVPVFLEKDVNMLINYDVYINNIDIKGIVVAFYYGTGIGNSIMINGEILVGKDGAAGEVGHIPVDGCDIECGCGNIGCLEAIAGGKYLAKLNKEKYSNTDISDMFIVHSNENDIKQMIDRMAMGLATEINILNPNKIIIGGGIINMKNFPKDYYLKKLKEHTRKPYPSESLDIIFTNDNEQAGVIGACMYAKKFINKPNS